MTMRLLLIRHGAAHHSDRGLIAMPRGCTGLTDAGVAQVGALARRLAATGEAADCAALLTSPVRRDRETADLLRPALPVRGVAVAPGLMELVPGAADRLTLARYRAAYGDRDPATLPDRPFAPGGEFWRDFLARVRATLETLAARHDGETVVAVTHAGFIVATVLVAFAIPRPGTGAWLAPAHTGLTEWRVADGRWELARYNDTAQLASSAPGDERAAGRTPDAARPLPRTGEGQG